MGSPEENDGGLHARARLPKEMDALEFSLFERLPRSKNGCERTIRPGEVVEVIDMGLVIMVCVEPRQSYGCRRVACVSTAGNYDKVLSALSFTGIPPATRFIRKADKEKPRKWHTEPSFMLGDRRSIGVDGRRWTADDARGMGCN